MLVLYGGWQDQELRLLDEQRCLELTEDEKCLPRHVGFCRIG